MANERQIPEQAAQLILEEKLNRYPFRHYLSLGGGCSVQLRPNYHESESEEENGVKRQMLAGKGFTRLKGDDQKEFNVHGTRKRRKRVSDSLAIDDEDKKGAQTTMQNSINCADADDNDLNTLSISTCYTLKLKKQIIKMYQTKSHKINDEYNIARINIGPQGFNKHSEVQQLFNILGASPQWDNKNVSVYCRDRFPYKQDESIEKNAPVFKKNLFPLPCAEDGLNMLQTSAQVHVHPNRSDPLSKCQERFLSHLHLEGAKVPNKIGKRRRYTDDISIWPTKMQDEGTGQEILEESPIDVGKNGKGRKKICKRRFTEDISILPSKIEGTGTSQVTQANEQVRFRDNPEEPPKLTIREDEFEDTSRRDEKNKTVRNKDCKGRITEEISILPSTIEAEDTSQVTQTYKKHVTFRDNPEEPPKLTIREDEFENTSRRDGKNENDRKKVRRRRFLEDISIFPSEIHVEDTNSIISGDKKHITFKDDFEGSAKVSNKEDELDKTSGRDEKNENDRKEVSTRRLTGDVSIFPSKIQVEDGNPVNQPIKKHVTSKDKEKPPESPNRRDEKSESDGNKDCKRRFLEDISIFPSKIQVEDTSQVAPTNTKHGMFKNKAEEPPRGPSRKRRLKRLFKGRFIEDLSILPFIEVVQELDGKDELKGSTDAKKNNNLTDKIRQIEEKDKSNKECKQRCTQETSKVSSNIQILEKADQITNPEDKNREKVQESFKSSSIKNEVGSETRKFQRKNNTSKPNGKTKNQVPPKELKSSKIKSAKAASKSKDQILANWKDLFQPEILLTKDAGMVKIRPGLNQQVTNQLHSKNTQNNVSHQQQRKNLQHWKIPESLKNVKKVQKRITTGFQKQATADDQNLKNSNSTGKTKGNTCRRGKSKALKASKGVESTKEKEKPISGENMRNSPGKLKSSEEKKPSSNDNPSTYIPDELESKLKLIFGVSDIENLLEDTPTDKSKDGSKPTKTNKSRKTGPRDIISLASKKRIERELGKLKQNAKSVDNASSASKKNASADCLSLDALITDEEVEAFIKKRNDLYNLKDILMRSFSSEESLFSQRKESPSKNKDEHSSDISGLIEERPGSDLETGDKTNENCIERPFDKPIGEAGPRTLTQTSKENGSSADFGDHTYSQCTTATEGTVNSDSSCHDEELFKDTHSAPENRPDLANTGSGAEAVLVTDVTLDPAEIFCTNSLEIANEETVESTRGTSPTEVQDVHPKVDDDFVTDVGQNLSKSPLHSSARSKYTDLSAIIVISSDESDSDLDQVMGVDTDDFTDRLDARNRSYFHQSPDVKHDNWSFGNAASTKKSRQNGLEDISTLEYTIARAGGFVEDVFHGQSLDDSGLQDLTKGLVLSVHSTPLHLNEKEATEDCIESSYEADDPTMTGMEHYKKRLIHQHEKPGVAPATAEEEDSSESPASPRDSSQRQRVARKRVNCRGQFRHQSMELFKLGNSLPTSLCKTKEPYNICTEKNLQMCNERGGPKSTVRQPLSNDFLTKSVPKNDSKFKDKPPIWRSNSLNNEIHEPQNMPSNNNNVENRNIGCHILPAVVPSIPDLRKNGTKSLPDSIGTIKNNAQKDSHKSDTHNSNSSNDAQETNRSRTEIDIDVLSTQTESISQSGASTSSEFDSSDCGPINLSTKNRQTDEPQQSNSYNVPYTNRNSAHRLNNTIPKQPSNVPQRPSQVQENDVAENDIVGTIVNEQLEAGIVDRDGCSVVTIPPNTLDPQRSNVILISFPNVQQQMSRMVTDAQQSPPETFDSAIMSLVNIARSMVELEFNVVSLPVLNRLYTDLSNYSSLQAVPAPMKSCIQETLESLVAYLIENMLHAPWSVRLKNFVHKMLQLDLRPHLTFLTASLALIRQKVKNDAFLGDLLAVLRHAPQEGVQISGPPRPSTRQTDEEVDAQRPTVLPNPPFWQYFPTGNPWAADFWNRFWTTDRHAGPFPLNSFQANFLDNLASPHVNILRSPTQRAVPETSVSRDVPSLINSNHPGRSRAPSNGSSSFPRNDPQTSALYANGLDNVMDGYVYRPAHADTNPNTRCNLTLERQELYLADNRCIPPKSLPVPDTIFPVNMPKQPKTPRGRPRSSTGQSTTPVKRSRNSTPSTDEERAVTREKRVVYRKNRDKDDVSNNFVAHRPTNGETSANRSLYRYRGAAPVSAFNGNVRAGSNLQRLPNSTQHDGSEAKNTTMGEFQETDGRILPQIRSEAKDGSVPEENVRPQTMIAGKAVILSNEIVRQKERAEELTISSVSAENVPRSTATEKDVESLLQANIIVNNLQNHAEKTSPKKSFHTNKTPKGETRKHTRPFSFSGSRNSRIHAQKQNPDESGRVNGSFECNVADKRSSCGGKAVPSTVIIEDGSMEVSKVNGSGRLDKGNATDLNDVTVERVTVNLDNSISYSTCRNDRSKAVESTCRITRVADAETTRAWQKLQLDVSIEKIPHFASHENAFELAASKRKSVEGEEQRKKMKTWPPLTEKRDGGAENELGTEKFDHNQNNLHKSRYRQRGETENPIQVMKNKSAGGLSAVSSGKEGAENADTAVSIENPIIEDISSDEEVLEPFRLHSMYDPQVVGDPKEILQTTEVSHCKLIEGSVKAVQDANRHLFEKPPVYTRPVTPRDVRRPFKNSSKREPLGKLVRFEEDANGFTCSLDLSGSSDLSPVPAFQTNVSPVCSPNFKSPTRPGLLVQPVAQTLPPKSPILPGSPVIQMCPRLQLVSPACATTPPSEGSRMNGGIWFGEDRDSGFFNCDRSLSMENDSGPSDDTLYEIKVGSKLYRVERSLYEKIPKGKLCYIRESYSFVRYFDDNQMELFINNLNLGEGSTIAKDLLKQVRGREVDPTDTEICLGQETGKNEVIHLSKGVVFSTLDYLAEAELYVEEMEKVQRYVPKDFYGFYKFVTGYQIVNQHHPISFQTFLTMHNTNGIRGLFKNYVNSLLEGRDLS